MVKNTRVYIYCRKNLFVSHFLICMRYAISRHRAIDKRRSFVTDVYATARFKRWMTDRTTGGDYILSSLDAREIDAIFASRRKDTAKSSA